MTLRCAWCGKFVTKTTSPWTFLNAYGRAVIQLHCPECREYCCDMIWRNLLYWPTRYEGMTNE